MQGLDDEIARWFAGKEFSFDWTSHNFQNWLLVLKAYRPSVHNILEIGSFEGRATVFFLEFFSKANITCLDTFAGGEPEQNQLVWVNLVSPDGRSWKEVLAGAEKQFDRNMSSFGDRVEKIKSPSIRGLLDLVDQKRIYDFVYVDGSHFRTDVFIDSLLVWKLTKSGSIILWDDYEWEPHRPASDRPKQAIDTFMSWYGDQIDLLHQGYQVIVKRK